MSTELYSGAKWPQHSILYTYTNSDTVATQCHMSCIWSILLSQQVERVNFKLNGSTSGSTTMKTLYNAFWKASWEYTREVTHGSHTAWNNCTQTCMKRIYLHLDYPSWKIQLQVEMFNMLKINIKKVPRHRSLFMWRARTIAVILHRHTAPYSS